MFSDSKFTVQSTPLLTKRYTLVITSAFISILLIFSFHDALPIEHYRKFAFTETAPVPIKMVNAGPQKGYFKEQPEWEWEVPKYASNYHGYARKPRNQDIIVLTASDGLGHNREIPHLLDRVLDDRARYCAKHGYTNLWLNTSRYDVGKSHRAWTKIPAVAEAFHLYPNAEWVWLIDADIILMNHEVSLADDMLSPEAVEQNVICNTPVLQDGMSDKSKGFYGDIHTPDHYRIEDVDVIITQDHQSVNTGSVFFRRSGFTRFLLEAMTDSRLMAKEIEGSEQESLRHLMLEHELVRKHVAFYPQRMLNAYPRGSETMTYKEGDLLVHFAGCWVDHLCGQWFEQYWNMKPREDEELLTMGE